MGRGDDTPPSAGLLSPGGTNGFGFALDTGAAAEGDVLVLNSQDPTDARAGETNGGNGRGRGTAVDIQKQAPRWPGEEPGGGGWEGGEVDSDGKRKIDGDVLVLDPDQGAVRRKVPGAPAFEKQLGWRERQAADALESEERMNQRRGAWGWMEAGGGGDAKRGGDGGDNDDPIERADRGTR